VHQFSGAVLLVARIAGIRTRIAHLRSAHDGRAATTGRRLYRAAMRWLVDRSATTVIGVSASALEAFWGADWQRDPRRRVIYNGIEAARFAPPRDPERREARDLRLALGLAADTRVVVHVGSFTPAKNHAALVDAAAVLLARRHDVAFVLVGDGPLRPAIAAAVAAHGLGASFRFTGNRDDVPALLRAADLLVLPSHWEGLPGVVLEALASGLPVVASPIAAVREIAGHAAGIRTADPASPERFARAIDEALGRAPAAVPVAPPLPAIFATETSMQRLLECYR
jgi:glycosyltransferase involved in cell wall biosynthesis